MTEKTNTRSKILDIAEASVLEKGFEATSIEEIVAGAEISRSGFFYHFKDKNALARAMLERYIDAENALYDDIFARAAELNDDPLHSMLIGLKMLAEMLADMPEGHPGCVIAATAYQDRLFDKGVQDLNREAILGWRRRFRAMFEEIAAVYEPRDSVNMDALGDMVSSVVEGGLVLQRALREHNSASEQIMLLRSYLKLLFSPKA
ncbi:MAG: TetR/AcrR family transcriptional regulator [Rhizobiales bacterium]|nr:TetR/AcrR family transcriptional regulator [Hyphomicrobiales bacterium]MBO6698898.1 TetR/AcrR family transcriptional regulator [Hyphomicrobiales bacterium]MBO6734849.1 TetR/AcrR family transcriptional regulator [Hyphomicrobiales bacterium]MBO6911345.1 TetR/AcrR family transcriptional regulator [Hyphomicrobiales bacterium]MBO6956157.1 TetR/AcrR family transcriptional regulator [Hyphomicrobiales bacterium]